MENAHLPLSTSWQLGCGHKFPLDASADCSLITSTSQIAEGVAHPPCTALPSETSMRRSARKVRRWFHEVQPGGTGPTRLKVMVPDRPLLLPAAKL